MSTTPPTPAPSNDARLTDAPRWWAECARPASCRIGAPLAQTATALHEDAIADCGEAGTFALESTPNSAGFSSPPVNSVLRFEGGGTLSILRVVRDGQLVWDPAAVGMASNHVDEVTCTFELANGVELEITGVYTGP